MITKAGRTETRELIRGDTWTGLIYMGTGTGTTAAADADTTLEAETTRKKIRRLAANGDLKAMFETTFTSLDDVGNSITEVGLLKYASAGSPFNHNVFTAEVKDNTKEFRFIIEVEIKS